MQIHGVWGALSLASIKKKIVQKRKDNTSKYVEASQMLCSL